MGMAGRTAPGFGICRTTSGGGGVGRGTDGAGGVRVTTLLFPRSPGVCRRRQNWDYRLYATKLSRL